MRLDTINLGTDREEDGETEYYSMLMYSGREEMEKIAGEIKRELPSRGIKTRRMLYLRNQGSVSRRRV